MDPRLARYLDVFATSDEEFLERMYGLVLRRDPEPEARERWLAKVADGTHSRAALIHELATSPEFERIRVLDDAVASARGARTRDERPRWLQAPPGTDERAIEVAWTLARYRDEKRVLDVGCANAEPAYLAALSGLDATDLTGVDLAEADVPGMQTVVADVRKLPFERHSFDIAFCISTLEHVGQDNRVYGQANESDDDAALIALRELRRVLSRKGRLLLTVPCGHPEHHGWLVQRDPLDWNRLFARAGFFIFEAEIYALTNEGWRSAPDFRATGVHYGDRGPGASAVLCVELWPGRLRQLLRPASWRYLARRRGGRVVRRLRRAA